MENQEALAIRLQQNYIDLAGRRLGGQALDCSDDFFAGMDNLLKPGRGVFIEDKYTDRGKWMDGWESRRSYGRTFAGHAHDHDWCIISLGVPGVIHGLDIDTNHFRGNAPKQVSVEACVSEGVPDQNSNWETVLARSAVLPHSQNLFEVDPAKAFTHVRLNMFPDGGIARFRVYGLPQANREKFLPGELVDLAAVKHGGRALLCSDMFFSDKNNLLMPGRGVNMGDGWETKRRRDPGPDWVIVKLAFEGSVQRVLVDTAHFKGNYPDRFSLVGANTTDDLISSGQTVWTNIILETHLRADSEHEFSGDQLQSQDNRFTHVRLNIFPDGGISRLRVYGYLQAPS